MTPEMKAIAERCVVAIYEHAYGEDRDKDLRAIAAIIAAEIEPLVLERDRLRMQVQVLAAEKVELWDDLRPLRTLAKAVCDKKYLWGCDDVRATIREPLAALREHLERNR